MRTNVLFASLAILSAIALGSCESATTEPPPLEVSKQEATAQSGDNVYWSSNQLNFSYEGDGWRLVRDQQQARHLTFYKNGTRVGGMDITWSGDHILKRRFTTPDGEWIEYAEDGTVLGSSDGFDAAQSGDVSALSHDDGPCEEIYHEAREMGDQALIAGTISLIAGGPETPIGLIAAGIFLWKTTESMALMTSYVRCRIEHSESGGGPGGGGSGGDDDDHECEPDPLDPDKCNA